MKIEKRSWRVKIALYAAIVFIGVSLSGYHGGLVNKNAEIFSEVWAGSAIRLPSAPAPLLEKGHAVDWWFVFKFNVASFPGCGGNAQRDCLFGGAAQDYQGHYSQQFVYASSENPSLQTGSRVCGGYAEGPCGGHVRPDI